MIPGVSFDEQAGSPRNYEKGELFAISVPNNPAPFAVVSPTKYTFDSSRHGK